MKSVKITASIFILTILVVIAGFFLLEVERTAINYWTLAAIVFSSVASLCVTVATIISRDTTRHVFFLAGVNSALWIYQIAVILTVIVTRFFGVTVGVFVFVQLLVNVGLIITLLVLTYSADRVQNVNNDTMNKIKYEEYDKPKRGGF